MQFAGKYFSAHSVRYQRECQTTNFFELSSDEPGEAAREVVLRKSNHWAYEEEWRVIRSRHGVVRFPPEALTGIILGCRTSTDDANEVVRWASAREKKPAIFKAVEKEHEFGLDILPVEGNALGP